MRILILLLMVACSGRVERPRPSIELSATPRMAARTVAPSATVDSLTVHTMRDNVGTRISTDSLRVSVGDTLTLCAIAWYGSVPRQPQSSTLWETSQVTALEYVPMMEFGGACARLSVLRGPSNIRARDAESYRRATAHLVNQGR